MTSREEALASKGRYGKVSQSRTGHPPFWYGQVVDVHNSGDYVKFKHRSRDAVWYHRRDLQLHPLDADQETGTGESPC